MKNLAFVLLLACAVPAAAGGITGGPWPTGSEHPVEPNPHPPLAERVAELGSALDEGFRLIVFGDQRALADGEWQAMNQLIRLREDREEFDLPLLAVIDTGDIVDDGSHSDQFHMLTEILVPLRPWPYLVGIGNHEVDNNRTIVAREHTATFLRDMVGEMPEGRVELHPRQLYWRADVAGVRILSLDTNDLVYGPEGEGEDELTHRARAQLVWLDQQLADDRGAHTTIVLCHHPFLHSSKKHRGQARKMWSIGHEGRTLAEMFAAADVDLVLVGHTHTYERFRMAHADGGSFQVINVSGRPRDSFLFYGAGQRRARDIAGEEGEYLRGHDWSGVEDWTIEQLDAMTGDEANQFLDLRVTPQGMTAEVFYLVDEGKEGLRSGGTFTID